MIKRIIIFFILLGFVFRIHAQRNTVLIIADDLSPDYFGFYEIHGDTVAVPNIRKLLGKGVRFKNLMSNPVCSPTRATLLTGRYSFRTGVGGVVGGIGGSNPIDTAEISIPKLLKAYNPSISKGNIGKWHLKNPAPAINLMSPQALGYDWYEGPFIGALTNFTNWTKYTNGVSSNITTYATTENVNNAVTWIKSTNQTKPFFLWLAFNAPHSPYHLPPNNLHSYTLSGATGDINTNPKNYFKAALQALDTEIGRFMDSLQALGKLDSTDIIFMGDNGNSIQTAQISNTVKAKGTVYQYGVNVPLIIAGPSVVNKGRVSNALVNTVDIFATIIDNFGYTNWASQIPTNKPVDAKSMMPILKNTVDSIRPWSFCELFKTTTDSSDGKGIRNREYKLIQFDYGAQEFYNLTSDPDENTNLLKSTLTITQFTNYNYLCHELNTLIGSGNYCKYGADINCSTGTTTGSATANTLVSGLSFTIPYTNAAIGTNYPSQSIASTGVTGLTAILTTRTYNSATGNWSFTVTGIPSGAGSATFNILNGTTTCNYSITVSGAPNSVVYNCSGGSTTGTATANTAVSGLSFSIPYSNATVGNSYSSQAINSTGVNGLTANLSAGTYSAATGNLLFNITGTPNLSGTASFIISYGSGSTCTYSLNVSNPAASIHSIENKVFSIYPNPAKDKLYLKLYDGKGDYIIEISDIMGKNILKLSKIEIDKGIDISSLEKGAYFLKLIENKTKQSTSLKFVVE
jgi:arylsulfatase A-like enzyme